MTTDEASVPHHPIDFDSAIRYLKAIFNPGDNIEFRALRTRGREGTGHATFRRMDESLGGDERLEGWLTQHNTDSWALYVGVNPRIDRRGSGRGGMGLDTDVAVYRCLFVDFDDATPEEAISRMEVAGLPKPTLLVASGRATGTHAYWRFDRPCHDSDLWQRTQIALNRILQADATIRNPSRIMRLPGSFNHRRGNACRILKEGPKYATLEALDIEPAEPFGPANGYDPDIDPDIENLGPGTHEYLMIDRIPESGSGTRWAGRNAALIAAAIDFKANNFPLDDALRILGDERAIARDGLSRAEAYRTIRNGYARPDATPSVTPRSYPKDTDFAALHEVLLHCGAAEMPQPWNGDWGGDDGEVPLPRTTARPEVPEDYAVGTLTALDVGDRMQREVDDRPTQIIEGEGERDSDNFEPSPRLDGRPVDVEDRPTISNVDMKLVAKTRGRSVEAFYKPIDAIGRDVQEKMGGWPRRCSAIGLFATKTTREGRQEIWLIPNSDSLQALMHDRANVRWVGGMVESRDGQMTAVTKKEFFAWAVENIGTRTHEGIAELPHYPLIPEVFYPEVDLPPATGEALEQFIEELNPATEHDRALMLAALMTPGWGGPPGTRPMFIFSSDYGQGSGKTATAKAIGKIWGRVFSLDYQDDWASMSKSIMSSDNALARVFLFDNMKGKFSSSSVESAVTAEYLTGWRSYVGTVRRINDATFFLTFNVPELSRDLAQRSIIVKVGRPKAGNFEERMGAFIREHQLQLVSDILDLLRRKPRPIDSVHWDRWRAWQEGVLARLPERFDVNEVAGTIASRRPSADSDTEEAIDTARVLIALLQEQSHRIRPEGAATILSAREIHKALVRGGMWQDRDGQAPGMSTRACLGVVRRRLNGLGVLRPHTNTDGNVVRLRVNDDGTPGDGFSERSPAYEFDYHTARRAALVDDGETLRLPDGPDHPNI